MRATRAWFAAGLSALLAAGVMTARPADAQTYPARPVKLVVPYAPGGPNDIMARLIAQKLSEALGGQFYVENSPGAGGTIGAGAVASAPADGHTLLVANQDVIVQPIIKSKVPYDPFKSFTPVTLVVSAPEMIVVHPSLPAKDMKELIESAQGQSRQVQLRQSRLRHDAASCLRVAVQARIRHRRHPRAVPGRRARGAIDALGSDADLPQRAAGGRAAYPAGHDAPARGRGRQALAVLPGRADAGGGRHSRA